MYNETGSVWVSPSPDTDEVQGIELFDVIINVSDSPGISLGNTPVKTKSSVIHHWFPIQEACQWNLGTLDAICLALDEYVYRRKFKVLVHCHGGACRAPTSVLIWIHTRKKASIDEMRKVKDIQYALRRGQVEPFDLEVLRDRVGTTYSTDGIAIKLNQKEAVKRFRLKERHSLFHKLLYKLRLKFKQ